MHFSSTELIAWMGQYLWPFIRIGALLGIAPIFGTRTVPVKVRLGLAVVLTLVIAPIIPTAPAIDPLSMPGMLTTVQQVVVGLAMGFAVTLVFSALITGGQLIAQLMGLGFASMMDPQNGISVPVVGQLYTILATLIFLLLNGHLVLIQVLVESFHIVPVGSVGLSREGIWQLVAWGTWVFAGAVLIALPAIAALLLVNIAFGVLTRAAPQLNIFAVGFPVTIIIGFAVMTVTLPHFLPKFTQLTDSVFMMLRVMLKGGA